MTNGERLGELIRDAANKAGLAIEQVYDVPVRLKVSHSPMINFCQKDGRVTQVIVVIAEAMCSEYLPETIQCLTK